MNVRSPSVYLLSGIAIAVGLWFLGFRLGRQDQCLDSGGSWNEGSQTCMKDLPVVP